jgi:hypothetical protein
MDAGNNAVRRAKKSALERVTREEGNLMRYILAISLVCAIGMPEAFATPAITSGATLVGKAGLVKPIKQKLQPTRRKTSRVSHKRSLGGIHPLVGSGDY